MHLRRTLVAASLVTLGAASAAQAGGTSFGISINSAPAYYPAPVYYAPSPVYYTPPPVYYTPAPVYYGPTYYAPYTPVYRVNYWNGPRGHGHDRGRGRDRGRGHPHGWR